MAATSNLFLSVDILKPFTIDDLFCLRTFFSPDGLERQWNTGQVKKVVLPFTHLTFP
jgi:hypothetical protein